MKGKGDNSQIKEVNVFDTGANQWREVPDWSPTVSTDTPLYLMDNGQLRFGDGVTGKRPLTGAPGAGAGSGAAGNRGSTYDEYVSDPLNPVPYTQKITLNYPRDFMTEDQ